MTTERTVAGSCVAHEYPEPHQDGFFDVDGLSAFLKVSPWTIYDWVHHRKIPHRKHGRRLAFLKSEILQWSASRAVRAEEELTRTPPQGEAAGVRGPVPRSGSLKTRRTSQPADLLKTGDSNGD